MTLDTTYTAFSGDRRIASGPLLSVALAVKRQTEHGGGGLVLVFDDASGRQIDIDTRGSDEEVAARIERHTAAGEPCEIGSPASADVPRTRGRPKLGVVAREVTLLPRHWDWLAAQPGGASVALRKLLDEARRTRADADSRRRRLERAYHFMSAMAGDRPGFEEAVRALFAVDERRFREWLAPWPRDVREHALALGFAEPTR